MKIISIQSRYIDEVVEIFCSAFEDSITFFTPVTFKVRNAIRDIFALLCQVFGQGFLVAVKNNQVYGYIVIADDIKKLWVQAITSGFLKKAVVSIINGEYGLTFSTLYRIAYNKLFYFRFEMNTKPYAQILSIAVHPRYQGMGIGQKLLLKGIKHAESTAKKGIKLEARPENTKAIKTYEKYGFSIVGEAGGLQGKWLIMIRE